MTRPKTRFMDGEKEDVKLAGVREEDVEDRVGWRMEEDIFVESKTQHKPVCGNQNNPSIIIITLILYKSSYCEDLLLFF